MDQTKVKLSAEWPKIMAKAWSDEKFKQRLLKDPKGVLKEHGIDIKEDVTYKVQEVRENEPLA